MKKSILALVLLALGLIGVFGFYVVVSLDPKYMSGILRYPFFTRWVHALPPALAGLFGQSFNEILYRVVPFLCSVGIAVFFATRFTGVPLWLRIIYGAAAGSLPLIYYYSSILYLEMPALLFMLPVFFKIEDIITKDWEDIKTTPAWYCLLVIGFIKQTVIPFLACLLYYETFLFYQKTRTQFLPSHAFPARNGLFFLCPLSAGLFPGEPDDVPHRTNVLPPPTEPDQSAGLLCTGLAA